MNDKTQQPQSSASGLSPMAPAPSAPFVEGLGQGEPMPQSIQAAQAQPGDVPKATELRAKFVEEAHQYVRDYIRQADQKAAFFFAGATALIAFLYKAGLIYIARWHKPLVQLTLLDVLALTTFIALFVAAVACLFTVVPRLGGSKRGLIYFGAIAEFESRNDYASEIRTKPVEELIDAKLMHVYDIAGICRNKFQMLKLGTYAGSTGVVLAIFLELLS